MVREGPERQVAALAHKPASQSLTRAYVAGVVLLAIAAVVGWAARSGFAVTPEAFDPAFYGRYGRRPPQKQARTKEPWPAPEKGRT